MRFRDRYTDPATARLEQPAMGGVVPAVVDTTDRRNAWTGVGEDRA